MKKSAEKKAYAVIKRIKKHLLAIMIVIFSCVIVLDVANYKFNPLGNGMSVMSMPSGSTADFSGQTMPENASDSDSKSSGGSDVSTDSSTSGDVQSGAMENGEMPSGEMPSGEAPSGEMPSGDLPSGMTPPGTASSDSDSTDTDTTESATTDADTPEGATADTDSTGSTTTGSDSSDTNASASFPQTTDSGNSMNNIFLNALILLRRVWLPILVVFSAADVVTIILFARKKRKETRERKAAEEKARKEALLAEVVPEEELEQPERKRRGFWVAPCCLFVAIAVVVAMLPTGSTSNSMTVNEEVVESTAEKNTISTVLSGTGTLTDSDAVEVTVPDSVDVTSYLVSNGDTVAAGDALATVDTTSVEAAIVELQDVIDELDADLTEEGEESADSTVTATADGKVKYIYAEAGTDVADTVYANGALMLISLDGLMAVDLETTAVSVGDSVTVTLSDGSTEKGTVASISEGKATVTLSDDASYMDEVSVSASDGTAVGSGTLYINSELKVLAYNGTVKSLSVSVGDEVDTGDTLMTLSDVGHTATYQAMLTRRSELETQMEELFKLTQDGTVYAQTAGIVSGVSEDLLSTSANGSTDVSCVELSNEPDSSAYSQAGSLMNYAATVTSVSGNELKLKVSSVVYSNLDYSDLSELSFANLKNDLTLTYSDQLWVYQNGWSKSVSVSNLKEGDQLLLTYPSGSTNAEDIIWIVYVGDSDAAQNVQSGNGEDGTENSVNSEETVNPNESVDDGSSGISGSTPDTDTTDENAGASADAEFSGDGNQNADNAAINGDASNSPDSLLSGQDENVVQENGTDMTAGQDALSGQMSASDSQQSEETTLSSALTDDATQSSTTEEETAVYDQYSISEKTICSVTPQEEMTITMSVDELDIMTLEKGQEAQITLDAISGQSFTGSVTQIELVGTNDGGNTKYNVKVTLDRTENMLAGMNGSVKITTATSDSVTTIPAEALVEQDGKTYVYTSYEKGSDTLGGLTEVETGVSDGDIVEIVSGLEEGENCFYKYAETVTYNFLAGKN